MKKFRGARILLVGLAVLSGPGPKAMGAEVELGQVVVTSTRTEVEISDSPQAISVIPGEEIRNTPDRTLPEVIQRAAGVLVANNGPMGSLATANIRGSEAGQVLILIDGRRVNDPQNGLFDLSNLPLSRDEIERIEVLRGGASALYGADAMGGVVNIITKTPSKEPYTRLDASYGRFATREYSLTHRWKPGPFGYGLFASRGTSNGFRPNSDYRALTLGGDVSYDFPWKGQLKLSARNIQKEVGTPGSVTFTDPDDRQKDNLTQLDLNYRDKIGPAVAVNFRGWQNLYRQTFEQGTQGFNTGAPLLHKSSQTGGDLQATTAIGGTHLVTGGLEGIEDRVNSDSFGVRRGTRGAVYLQDEIEVVKAVTATLGLRYDMNSLFNNQWDPRAAVLVRLPGDTRVRASVARSYRAPTFNDLFWPASAFVAGNPSLQPETAWSYELGGEKKFSDRAVFKVAGFYRDVKDLIRWAPDASYVWRPTNVQTAHIWGAEAELVLSPLKGLSVPLNYSYLYPRDQSTGEPIANKPKHIFNAGVEYTAPFGLKASVKGRYVQYYLNNTSTLNRDYFVLDARLGYEFTVYEKFKGQGFLSLTNALNREYQVNEGYPMPPRSLTGGLSLFF